MGQPRVTRSKKAESPLKPYDKPRIDQEKRIKQMYGLRRKREIWRAEGILREFRRRARDLLARPNEKMQNELFERIRRLGLEAKTIEDVLELKLEDLLNRRLETIVWKRGLTKTPRQARQLIVHRHVIVDGRIVRWPSYLVLAEEEGKIDLSPKVKPRMLAAEQAAAKVGE